MGAFLVWRYGVFQSTPLREGRLSRPLNTVRLALVSIHAPA